MFKNRLEFKGAVIGMILGDGHIENDKRDNGNCSISLTSKDKKYAQYKMDMLNYLTGTTISKRKGSLSKFRNGVYFGSDRYRVRTKRHPFYTDLHKRFYYGGRKTIDSHLMRCLTKLGLAIWYMDDGSYNPNTKGNSRGDDPSYHVLYTNSFNRTEHELMQRELAKKFGLQMAIHKNRDYFFFYVKANSKQRFKDLIEPHIIPSMLYKLGKERTNGTRKSEEIVRHHKQLWN